MESSEAGTAQQSEATDARSLSNCICQDYCLAHVEAVTKRLNSQSLSKLQLDIMALAKLSVAINRSETTTRVKNKERLLTRNCYEHEGQ